jgi:aspartate kinase
MYRPTSVGNAIIAPAHKMEIGPLRALEQAARGMARIVQKFGGTSVADIERIKSVARRVKREADAGHEVAVVVSAMAGVTNQLVAWVNQISPLHDAREYDVVVATGEQVTSGLLAIALQEIGVNARSWLGWQMPLVSDGVHGKARIQTIDTREIEKRFAQGQVAVVAGFQGLGPDNRVTTLGRGGPIHTGFRNSEASAAAPGIRPDDRPCSQHRSR